MQILLNLTAYTEILNERIDIPPFSGSKGTYI